VKLADLVLDIVPDRVPVAVRLPVFVAFAVGIDEAVCDAVKVDVVEAVCEPDRVDVVEAVCDAVKVDVVEAV